MNETEKLIENFHKVSRILGRLTVKPCTDAEYDLAHANVMAAKAALLAHVEGLREELANLARDEQIFIPGVWSCFKCGFVLTRTSISATTGDFGTTSADREDSEPCPNDGTEMRRVDWRTRCGELGKVLEGFFNDPATFHPYSELRAENERLKAEAKLQRDMVAAIKHTVVATIGGEDNEGNPTSEINYLQRLRALVKLEQENAALREENAFLKESLS